MSGLITNLIRGHYFPLSKPNDAAAAPARALSLTPHKLISLQEPKLVLAAF